MVALLGAALFASVAGTTLGPADGKTLVWQDEFDLPGLPDPKKWDYEEGFIRNKEKQYYTRGRIENGYQEDGRLVIQARKEAFKDAEITSASLTTREAWKYGYFEVRAKVPTGKGTWPAIWFLPTARNLPGAERIRWPRCGEIDLMENVGFDPGRVHFTVHTEAYNHTKGTQKSAVVDVERFWEDFHVYGLDWKADKMDFYFDGKQVFSYANDGKGEESWPFDKPFYLILNLAIGGGWAGLQGIDDAIFPAKYQIDYVRVFR